MKVLVTGGAGYIGSHMVRLLVQKNHDVVVLDNLSHGHREAVHHKAELIQGDIENVVLLEKIFAQQGIEAVMHFAADIEVGESVLNPFKYYQNNFSRPLRLFYTMQKCGVNLLIFSSTAAVYGNPTTIPIDETHERRPINPYGRAKMMTEMAIEDFHYAYGLGYTVLRYFNVAGASPDATIGEDHEPESHLIPRILDVALKGSGAISVYGSDYPTRDGTCIRDYIHVEDLVYAHLLALEKLTPQTANVYNLGSENGFTVYEVIEACRRVTGRPIASKIHERRAGDPAVLIASSRKIKQNLHWERQYPDLDTIVAHAWNWHLKKQNLPKNNAEQEWKSAF